MANHEQYRSFGILLAAIVGVPILLWRGVIAERQASIAEDNHVAETYTRAIEQLGAQDRAGNPALELRLGGMNALEMLAKANRLYHPQIMEVLCAYLRMHSPINLHAGAAPQSTVQLNLDIAVAITIIGRREVSFDTQRLNLSSTCLRGVDLEEADLRGVNFLGADLSGAYLQGVELQGALLDGANFNSCQLIDANLRYAELYGADLQSAEMSGADFAFADLNEANLFAANLSGAELYETSLNEANLERVSLRGAKLTEVKLIDSNLKEAIVLGAELVNVDLRGADYTGVDFEDALCKGVVWKEGDPPL